MTDADTKSAAPPPGAHAGATAETPRQRRRAGGAESPEERRRRNAEQRVVRRTRREPWLRAGRSLIRWMPLPVACVVGECVGLLLYFASGWLRRQTLANLDRAFGDTKTAGERRAIARRCYGLIGRGVFAWIVLHRMGRDRALATITEVVVPADARAAIADGAILLSQHFGAFEVTGPWLVREFGMRPVGRSAREGDATSMLIAMRREMGAETIEQGNAREIVRVLRAKGTIAMLMDQDIRHVNGIFVPFFGHPAHTPIGPATFAVRMKVPLVYTTIEWTSLTRHRVTVGPVLHARTDLPHDEAVADLTARATKAGEDIIRSNPSHWIWLHKRWRTQQKDGSGESNDAGNDDAGNDDDSAAPGEPTAAGPAS